MMKMNYYDKRAQFDRMFGDLKKLADSEFSQLKEFPGFGRKMDGCKKMYYTFHDFSNPIRAQVLFTKTACSCGNTGLADVITPRGMFYKCQKCGNNMVDLGDILFGEFAFSVNPANEVEVAEELMQRDGLSLVLQECFMKVFGKKKGKLLWCKYTGNPFYKPRKKDYKKTRYSIKDQMLMAAEPLGFAPKTRQRRGQGFWS